MPNKPFYVRVRGASTEALVYARDRTAAIELFSAKVHVGPIYITGAKATKALIARAGVMMVLRAAE